jgi:hypothetical protein
MSMLRVRLSDREGGRLMELEKEQRESESKVNNRLVYSLMCS